MLNVIIITMKNSFYLIGVLLPIFLVACSTQDDSVSSSQNLSTSDSTSESVTSSISSESNSSRGSSMTSGESYIPVESVSLNKSSLELYEGESFTLEATVLPSNATNKKIVWSCTKRGVAVVKDGKVTANGYGEAVISAVAADGNIGARCSLTVKETVESSKYVMHGLFNGESEYTNKQMAVNPSASSEYMLLEVELHKDDLFKIHLKDDFMYGWTHKKSSVSTTLIEAGPWNNIKVKKDGIYNIYCNSVQSDGGYIYLNRVRDIGPAVVPVSGISLDRTGKYLVIDDSFYLYESISPSDATNKDVSWKSSKPEVASVSPFGRVYGLSVGKTVITATTSDGGYSATCTVFVSDSEVPMYYLYGTIGGEEYEIGNYTYAAYIDTVDYLTIPDVELESGDILHVYNTGADKPLEKNGNVYTLNVEEKRSVNVRLYILDVNKNYLRLIDK